jgi:hypothetical protein
MIKAITAHGDEVRQLRMVVAVLVKVPPLIEEFEQKDTREDAQHAHKLRELVRIASLYAALGETHLDHRSIEDVIEVLQEGLA